MRYLFGFLCVCALGVVPLVGGSEARAQGSMCQSEEDCDDGSECTRDACNTDTGTCDYVTLEGACTFDGVAEGSCWDGVCCAAFDPEESSCSPELVGKVDECTCEPNRCQIDADCDDYNDCTEDLCSDTGRCSQLALADETLCAGGTCEAGACSLATDVLPCTEQGIRNAVAAGGDEPYTFDCVGPTTVVTEAEIRIYTEVTMDGQGELIVDGNGTHGVFWIADEATVEMRGFGVVNGVGGIDNEGTLTLAASNPGDASHEFDCKVSNNRKDGHGGGIFNNGTLTVLSCTVSGNRGDPGGGIANHWLGTLTLTNSTVWGNSAVRGGGGVLNFGTMEVKNSTVSANQANYGAGIYNGHTMTLMNSTVWGNSATAHDDPDDMPDRDSGKGGGIFNGFGPLTLTNTTVSGNTAVGVGTGIASLGGALTLTNSTVSGSVVFTIRLFDPDEPPSIMSAATLIDGVCDQIGDGVVWTSNGYNIESPGDTCGFDQATDQVGVTEGQLNLGPLQDNGGPLQDNAMTHALGSGSVAIDRIPVDACEVDEDQRGVERPQGPSCDVGALELEGGSTGGAGGSGGGGGGGGGCSAIGRGPSAPWGAAMILLVLLLALRRREGWRHEEACLDADRAAFDDRPAWLAPSRRHDVRRRRV